MNIEPEVVARMERFIRYYERNAVDDMITFGMPAMSEARAIVALLPKPVDSDFIASQEIAQAGGWSVAGTFEDMPEGCAQYSIFAAIKRGRELAARDAS